MGLSHAEVRPLINEAFRRQFGREPVRPEAQTVHGVAELETSCGDGWKLDEHDACHNFGAIQKGSWTGRTFRHQDTRPNEDGTSTPYWTDFRAYDNPVDGIFDLVKVVLVNRGRINAVLPSATKGDLLGVSRGLYSTVYYEGWGRNADERIGHHLKALSGAVERIARELGEPLPDGTEPAREPPRLLFWRPRNLMVGDDVALVQRVVQVEPDEVFGEETSLALKRWQKARRLKVDGKWGPVCRLILETEFTGEDLEALGIGIGEVVPPTQRDPSAVRS